MRTVEIKNWKDLKEQFGVVKDSSLKTAPQISKELKEYVLSLNYLPDYVYIECNEKSEARCVFNLIQKDDEKLFYEYQGTAN